MIRCALIVAVVLAIAGGTASAVEPPPTPTTKPVPRVTPIVRTPKYPLKTARSLYTDQEIATARDAVKPWITS